jgi:DNA-binding Lrp family transcriptional regulator
MNNKADIQKRILGEISMRGNISAEALAKEMKVRPHVVRYHLHQLLKSGSLRRTVLMDQRKLGYLICTVLFNMLPHYQTSVLRFLRSHRCVSWLTQNSGFREFEMALVVKSPADVIDFMTELAEKTGASLLDQMIAYEEDMYDWGLRIYMPQPALSKPIVFTRSRLFEADELDTRILRTYREIEDTSPSALSRRIATPQSTLQHRLTKLRDAAVITEDLYVLIETFNPIPKGCVFLKLNSRTKAAHQRLLSFCQTQRQVSTLLESFGNWDYRLIAYGKDMQDFFEFEDALKATLQSDVNACHISMRRRFLKLAAGV